MLFLTASAHIIALSWPARLVSLAPERWAEPEPFSTVLSPGL